MTRENQYTIEIQFDLEGKTKEILSKQVPYVGSMSFYDDFTIYENKIIIEAKRSSIIKLDSIFYNHFSSLYNQILKSLLFYYATSRHFVKIKTITISRKRSQKVLDRKSYKSTQFNQVLDDSFKLKDSIQKTALEELFNETAKGKSTLIAVSYLLIANNSLGESDKFEKLWKAYNKLYTHMTGSILDHQCLRYLREFIINNPNILTLSTRKVFSLNTDQFRNNIRWRGMLLDNYDTESKTESFRDFVLRYSDKRIMEIILETKFGYREDFLRNKGFLTAVSDHINNEIAANTKNDNEIVSLLTGKYMYFVRNKTFHGEKIDSTFRLTVNKEDKELKFLNGVLEAYLIDLINANNLY
jgi:hypothetical protein